MVIYDDSFINDSWNLKFRLKSIFIVQVFHKRRQGRTYRRIPSSWNGGQVRQFSISLTYSQTIFPQSRILCELSNYPTLSTILLRIREANLICRKNKRVKPAARKLCNSKKIEEKNGTDCSLQFATHRSRKFAILLETVIASNELYEFKVTPLVFQFAAFNCTWENHNFNDMVWNCSDSTELPRVITEPVVTGNVVI